MIHPLLRAYAVAKARYVLMNPGNFQDEVRLMHASDDAASAWIAAGCPIDAEPERLPVGATVRTVRPGRESSDWSAEALASRRWDVTGTVVATHDAHGLTYEVRHADGSIGHYEPRELVPAALGTCPSAHRLNEPAPTDPDPPSAYPVGGGDSTDWIGNGRPLLHDNLPGVPCPNRQAWFDGDTPLARGLPTNCDGGGDPLPPETP